MESTNVNLTSKKVPGINLFYEITDDWFNKMINHFKKVEKHEPHTIQTMVKNFKSICI
jgi:hypothetical protein